MKSYHWKTDDGNALIQFENLSDPQSYSVFIGIPKGKIEIYPGKIIEFIKKEIEEFILGSDNHNPVILEHHIIQELCFLIWEELNSRRAAKNLQEKLLGSWGTAEIRDGDKVVQESQETISLSIPETESQPIPNTHSVLIQDSFSPRPADNPQMELF